MEFGASTFWDTIRAPKTNAPKQNSPQGSCARRTRRQELPRCAPWCVCLKRSELTSQTTPHSPQGAHGAIRLTAAARAASPLEPPLPRVGHLLLRDVDRPARIEWSDRRPLLRRRPRRGLPHRPARRVPLLYRPGREGASLSQVSHKSLSQVSLTSLSQVSHKSLTSLSPVSHKSLTQVSLTSLSHTSLTQVSHKSLTSLSQVSHKSLTPHSSPPCQTPLSPPLHHTERISSQISSIRFNFAHPPISPICRTPLFPYLTFDSRFLRSLPSASTRPLRRLGPATSSSFMAT